MSELGETLGKLVRDKEDMKQSMSPHGGGSAYRLIASNKIALKQVNLVIQKLDFSNSNSFILGHSTNGVLGVANGLGGGQIVLGNDGFSEESELVRRRYEWRSQSELDSGAYSTNMSIEEGKLRLR